MADSVNSPGGAMQVSRGIVVATIQVDLDQPVLDRLRDDLLTRVEKTGSQGVVLDLSGLHTLDASEFAAIREITSMVTIMGARPVLAGLRSGVVSALIDSGVEVEGIQAAVDLDAAFELLLPETNPEKEEPVLPSGDGEVPESIDGVDSVEGAGS